ncbi:hypothetical protein [Rhizobium sp. NPDC090279]|uniref:hypothetical protein n=1 Tax=Rhizobium sp. NPDC090279 TaxID=3364499 RepID=UPI00383BD365
MSANETNLARAASKLQGCWYAAYAAFAEYPSREILHASPLRDAEKILRKLSSAPLAKLSGDALGGYAMSAMTTVGDVDDYRHYLPRILQHALLTPGEPGFDPLMILSKLEYANWCQWPASERLAVGNVFHASWVYARLQHPDELDAMNWFMCAIRLEKDINSVLDLWLSNLTPNSALQLADVISQSDGLPCGRSFWKDLDLATRRTILGWLCGDGLQAAIMAVVDDIADEDRWRIDSIGAALAPLRAMPYS